ARSRRGGCPGRDAVEPADRAAPRGGGGPLPAHLDRRGGGHGHRFRTTGRRAAAAADPRPDEGPPRRARRRAQRGPDHRDARRRLLRHPRAVLRRRGERTPVGLDRARAAYRLADHLRRGRPRRRRRAGTGGGRGRGREVPRVPRQRLARGLREPL
ncbi:MAG: FIG01121484: hypothetical protein, partial [uncultured Nocardioidaceae bacterium]